MRRAFVLVAMLCCGVATSFALGSRAKVGMDSLVNSRCWSFRPVTMQNPDIGTTRDIYQYNVFLNLDGSNVQVQMPVEWVSMSIFTEEFETQAMNYSATFVDGQYWRILFTLRYNNESWSVEVAAEPATGRVDVAIVAAEGVMRYVGAFYALKREKE